MKKIFIGILIVILVIVIVFGIVRVIKAINFVESLDTRGIGKTLHISIDADCDAEQVRKGFKLWSESERIKLANYLEENNLRIKKGRYKINQTTTFEEATKIFKFEKIQ